MRISTTFGPRVAALLFAVVFLPCLGWASGSVSKNCPAEPAQNVAITSGETYYGANCKLSTTGDVDTFQFTATAGATYGIVAGLGASPTSNVCITLYAPGVPATVLYSGCTAYQGPYYIDSVATNQKLTKAGTYTIAVTESTNATITYGLSLERLSPAPADGIALTLSKAVTGMVTPLTAQDAYTFEGATTGEYEVVTSVPNSATSNACLAIYNPDGTVVAYGLCTAEQGPYYIYSTGKTFTPTQDGTFVVVVYAGGNDTTVNYNLEVSCLLGTCPATPPKCTLGDTLSYSASTETLTMNFTIGTPMLRRGMDGSRRGTPWCCCGRRRRPLRSRR